MEKNVSSVKIFNVVICAIILVLFTLFASRLTVNANSIDKICDDEVLPSSNISIGYNYRELIFSSNVINVKIDTYKEIKDLDYYLTYNDEFVNFILNVFGFDYDFVVEDLKNRNIDNNDINENNIALLKDKDDVINEYFSFEHGFIEYLFYLKNNGLESNNDYIPYEGSSEYIENLIIYFSNIYSNVDSTLLLSIAACESANFKSSYMLRCNNVFGGMSSHGLIKYKNIEYGILTYVRMMSRNYYDKGLNDMYSIGRVYCPVFIDGVKTASPHWIDSVSVYLPKYTDYSKDIYLDDIFEV